MKKIIAIHFAILFAGFSFSQTLYVPSGTSGIGTSSNGNVGINTTNPQQILHIEKSGNTFIRLVNTSANGSTVNFGPVSSNGYKETQLQFENEFGLYDNAQSAWRFKIKSDGKVGVGLTNPSHQLTVGMANSTIPSAYFTALFGKGIAVGSGGNATATYLYNQSETGVHGVNAFNYATGTSLPLYLGWGGGNVYVAKDGGNVGIGTTSPDPAYKLSVNGSIRTKEVRVEAGWPDFVFEEDYTLRPLEEVETYISENKHLPEIPSEAEVTENGIYLGEMNAKLLQKIEELTLYMIEMNKRVGQLETENAELKKKITE